MLVVPCEVYLWCLVCRLWRQKLLEDYCLDRHGSEFVSPHDPINNVPTMFVSKADKPSINITHPMEQPSRTDVFSSVAAKTNQNLTAAQKELLLWHWELSHIGFQWLQSLMVNPTKQTSLDDGTLAKPVFINIKNHQAKTCSAQCAQRAN